MKEIKSVIYISYGNIPSRMAHTIQIVKMSEALSKQVNDFKLLVGGKKDEESFNSCYEVKNKFELVYLPTDYKFNPNHNVLGNSKTFCDLALQYVILKRPDLIYTRNTAILKSLLLLGIPIIYESHEVIETDYKVLISKNLVSFVTLSMAIAEKYYQQGLSPKKTLIAHSAVDFQSFLPYMKKEVARQKLVFHQDKKIIIYSGHLYEHKGILTILRTALMLPEHTFILVGGWEDDIQKVKEVCARNNISNVQVIGHVPQSELATYLYAADILLLPTSKIWELAESTSPLKLFEYMSVNRPIVATALSNIMTVLRDGENALLVEPDNPIAFKQAIDNLFTNPTLATSIANVAFQEAQKFTWDNRAERILQFVKAKIST